MKAQGDLALIPETPLEVAALRSRVRQLEAERDELRAALTELMGQLSRAVQGDEMAQEVQEVWRKARAALGRAGSSPEPQRRPHEARGSAASNACLGAP